MRDNRPGVAPFTERTPRVVAARRLLRRRYRDADARFLAEGPQAVREALRRPGTVTDLFVAGDRHPDLVAEAQESAVRVSLVTDRALASLTETVTPQGVVAVCRHLHVDLPAAPASDLVVVLAGIADPGNAGTVLRTADAAGAGTVIFPDSTVDPYNGKCVRASAGSLFHVEVVRGGEPGEIVGRLRAAGYTVLAADAYGDTDLDEIADAGGLAPKTVWLFGGEAHGLPADLAERADSRVRVPLYGRAESLNLAAAAAVCLYASAKAHRGREGPA